MYNINEDMMIVLQDTLRVQLQRIPAKFKLKLGMKMSGPYYNMKIFNHFMNVY